MRWEPSEGIWKSASPDRQPVPGSPLRRAFLRLDAARNPAELPAECRRSPAEVTQLSRVTPACVPRDNTVTFWGPQRVGRRKSARGGRPLCSQGSARRLRGPAATTPACPGRPRTPKCTTLVQKVPPVSRGTNAGLTPVSRVTPPGVTTPEPEPEPVFPSRNPTNGDPRAGGWGFGLEDLRDDFDGRCTHAIDRVAIARLRFDLAPGIGPWRVSERRSQGRPQST